MLLSVSAIPYSIYSLFAEDIIHIRESYSHRNDRLVKDHYEENFFIESLCNEASNLSPISTVPGTVYHLPSRYFMSHFLEVGG